MRTSDIPGALDIGGNVALIVIALWLVLRHRANRTYDDAIVMKIHLSRVFVLRIWLGRRLLELAMWVIGGRAEVLLQEMNES